MVYCNFIRSHIDCNFIGFSLLIRKISNSDHNISYSNIYKRIRYLKCLGKIKLVVDASSSEKYNSIARFL